MEKWKNSLIKLILLGLLAISNQDPASLQVLEYKEDQDTVSPIQTDYGVPVDDITSSLSVGKIGPLLLQDNVLLEAAARFVREYIPARGNTGKGAGAFGYFEVTGDITEYTKAKVFSKLGEKTKILVRFSVIGGEPGAPDTISGRRGFSIKFYTKDGIWDLVCTNSDIFFPRDALTFIAFQPSRNPVTHLRDPNMFWDYIINKPESVYSMMLFIGDGLNPDGYQHMDAFALNTFKMVNNEGKAVYVRFHLLSKQGIRNLSPQRAANLTAIDPDYCTRKLYNAIERGNYPSWTLYIQVMTFEQAEAFPYNPFDSSRPWSKEEFPLIEAGKVVLNKNPNNYFADVEQAAFAPSHMVPGIEPSPDKLLQGRLLAYKDAQYYRLGTNYMQLPVNRPFKKDVVNYQQNGQGAFDIHDGAPNYFPNSFNGPKNNPRGAISTFHVSGDVARYNNTYPDNYDLAISIWNSLTDDQKELMVTSIVNSLRPVKPYIQRRAVQLFWRVSSDFGSRLRNGLTST